MVGKFIYSAMVIGFLSLHLLTPGTSSLAQLIDSISSEHVRLRMPAEREALGRDSIADLERCYVFMNRATGESLPRKILINISWDHSNIGCNRREGIIFLGMDQPAAAANLRAFLLHHAAREMARLGLLELAQGAEREDTEFLFEGMVKILVHEYEHSSRNLESAWAISRLLDEMQMLGLATQRAWSTFSGGRRCLRSAAPGVTFLMTFRELLGRERPLKFFEALRKMGLNQSLSTAFKAPVPELESIWLKRVRAYDIADEITVTSDPPQHLRTEFVPETGRPGSPLRLKIYVKHRAGNLLPDGLFLKDERTGRLLQAQTASEKGAEYFVLVIPIESDCPPGQYSYQITAIDESGNLRRWNGNYRVAAE